MEKEPDPIDPSEAEEMFSETSTGNADVLSLHYHHVTHDDDASLKIPSINSIHSQIITWYEVETKRVKRVMIQHSKENMTHSFHVDLNDGRFPVESCPCNVPREKAYVWVNNGRGLDKVAWRQLEIDEPVADNQEQVSHLLQ